MEEENSAGNYFESYDNISVHNLMLRDFPRVFKYREAIMASKAAFKDKIVMDVGSGTGLLSLFCAQAGAKHVYAVEASEGIYELSKAIVKANNLEDRITIINGVIEEIELPNGITKVDIIVSEWMGVYLLHESMLNSVVYARDKWLQEDGLMYPSVAYLYVCPVEMDAYLNENLKFWSNYNDLNFDPIAKIYRQLLIEKPLVETVSKSQLVADEEKILASFDLKTVKLEELESIQSYNMSFTAQKKCNLHGFAFWFDVVFTTDSESVTLSTGPGSPETHWKQTIAILPEALDSFVQNKYSNNSEGSLALNENDEFECYVILNQTDDNARCYEIDIGVNLNKEEPMHPHMTGEEQAAWYESMNHEEDDEEDEEDEEDMPCNFPKLCECNSIKCAIIRAQLEKYKNQAADAAVYEEIPTLVDSAN